MMLMKNERCNLKKIFKKIVDFCIFPTIIIICLTFTTGAYYERNIYYKLDDITIEIGEKLPEEINNYLKILDDSNFTIETNAPLDEDGNTKMIGTFSYFLVYNDPVYKYSKLTNVKATITVVDTISPVITAKENNKFKYNSEISANDIVDCYDLSGCTLELKDSIDTTISGETEVSIIATDGGNNKSYITTSIIIEEKPKPKPVYNFYYSSSINYMNEANNQKNSLLTEEEKNNLRYSVVEYAKQFIGNPYVYGGTSLTNGTDCSGFTMSIYANFGYLLPRTSTSQIYIGIDIPASALQPGDLVVYHYGHVGIYVGNGMMVHAGTTQTGIVMAPIFEGARSYRRVIY